VEEDGIMGFKNKIENFFPLINDDILAKMSKQILKERIKQDYKIIKIQEEKIAELNKELFYWKKYKHLEFDKLEEDEDYWDCVVMEHNLKRNSYIPEIDEYRDVYPKGREEYDDFCKYFPKPIYSSDEDDSE
tara:strand:- start:30 stop:425 length:396 start_codon:yes stop_codon:yes gene_type:complete